MPTGYTAAIGEGCTFEQFVWSCARAFGANVMMRDDPKEQLAEFARLTHLSPDEVRAEADAAYAELVLRKQNSDAERATLQSKYETMLSMVIAWEPPTKDHEGLRTFMIEQIQESIRFDCGSLYETPVKQSAAEWLDAKLTELRRSIEYHRAEDKKEIERTKGRNEWNRALRASVPQPNPPIESAREPRPTPSGC